MKKNNTLETSAYLVDRYEEIRTSFLETGFCRNASGAAVFQRGGMVSWMDTQERHWDDILSTKRDSSDAWRIGLDRQNEIVYLLSRMTLSSLEVIV